MVTAPAAIATYNSFSFTQNSVERTDSGVDEEIVEDIKHLELELENERKVNKQLLEKNQHLKSLTPSKLEILSEMSEKDIQFILANKDTPQLEAEIQEFKNTISKQKEILKERKEKISEVKSAHLELEKEIDALQEKLGISIYKQQSEHREASQEREAVIKGLKKDLKSKTSFIDDLQSKIKLKDDEKEQLRKELQDSQLKADNLLIELNSKKDRLAEVALEMSKFKKFSASSPNGTT